MAKRARLYSRKVALQTAVDCGMMLTIITTVSGTRFVVFDENDKQLFEARNAKDTVMQLNAYKMALDSLTK